MLGKVRKRKRMDNFEYQALRSAVKEGDDVIERFEKKFKEIKVEGNRKSVTGVIYTESKQVRTDLHDTKYIKSKMEALYMGTERV